VRNRGHADPCGWREEGQDLLRAVAGGAIVGMPLLYTMEMWYHGMTLSDVHLLVLLGATLLLNVLFCYLSGFRPDCSLLQAANEAVTSVGIAIVFSVGVLWLIGELSASISAVETIGKVLLTSAAVSIGISFANSQMERSRTGDDEESGGQEKKDAAKDPPLPGDAQLQMDLREMAAALAGSTVFALSIAPTEEVTLIAARLSPIRLLAVLAASMLLCYIILFAAKFREYKVHVKSPFQHPLAETLLTSAVSLLVAAGLLFLMGDRSILTHPSTMIACTVTLGLPAVVGGAAGRLIT
jgi:putative integral membrane protein (TIGR02587 family)